MPECYLGIDVGFSATGATTGLCLVIVDGTNLRWRCRNTRTSEAARRQDLKTLIAPRTYISGVGIDGPLAPGLKKVKHYRSADALLSRGSFQQRCKPGQTNVPTGQRLHCHASRLAELVIDLQNNEQHFTLAESSHPSSVHQYRIVETFPNAFLAFLLAEGDFPARRIERGEKSDEYWKIAVREGYLEELFKHLIPGCQFDRHLETIADHDHRAAFICALAAMCVSKAKYVATGDPEDGDIFLPPVKFWGFDTNFQFRWPETTLRKNMDSVRKNRRHRKNHEKARVICNGRQWMQGL